MSTLIEQSPPINGGATALTVKELLLEVRADVKTLDSKFESFVARDADFHQEVHLTLEDYGRRIACIEEGNRRRDEERAEMKTVIASRETQLATFRGIFGPYVVPAVISLFNMLALIFVAMEVFFK